MKNFRNEIGMLAFAMVTSHAIAQNTSPADSSRVYDLDEVVVVSQPKETFRLRQQPLSSTMIGNEEINARSMRDLRDITAYAPAFVMPAYGSRLTSSIYVRGLGSRTGNPTVGLYLDGMPLISKSAHNIHIYQTERVDILRGPQGTLYGQNAEGGLLRIYTRDPMTYQGTQIRLGLGSYGYRNIEAAHYAKPTDDVAFSVAAFYNGQDGNLRNQNTQSLADAYNEAGARLRLGANLSQRTSLNFVADYQFVRQNAFPYGLLDEQSGNVADPSTTFNNSYRRNIFNTALNIKHRTDAFEFNSTTSWQFLSDDMTMDQDYLPEDYLRLTQDQLQNSITQEFTFKGTANSFWRHSSGLYFSYQWLRTDAPVHFGTELNSVMSRSIQRSIYQSMLSVMAARYMQLGLSQEDAAQTAATVIQRAGGVNVDLYMDAPGLYHTPQLNAALFHESSLSLSDRLTAVLGLRYDLNHTRVHYQSSAIMDMSVSVMGEGGQRALRTVLDHKDKNTFSQLLPKAALSWRLDSRGSNVYATISKGYRAGGYNIQMFSDILQEELIENRSLLMSASEDVDISHTDEDYANVDDRISYKPETSWNYEIGAHFNFGGLADNGERRGNANVRRSTFDVSLFLMQVRDQQISVMASQYGYGRMMVNAGKSRSYGIEASTSFGFGPLDFNLGYAYTHATFTQYKDTTIVNNNITLHDLKGKYVPYVPQYTISARADYTISFGKKGNKPQISNLKPQTLTLGCDLIGQGKTYWDELNTISQNFYALLGAHAALAFKHAKLNIWARNLTQTHYATFAVQSAATGETKTFAQSGNPFQFGADITINF